MAAIIGSLGLKTFDLETKCLSRERDADAETEVRKLELRRRTLVRNQSGARLHGCHSHDKHACAKLRRLKVQRQAISNACGKNFFSCDRQCVASRARARTSTYDLSDRSQRIHCATRRSDEKWLRRTERFVLTSNAPPGRTRDDDMSVPVAFLRVRLSGG